MANIMSSISNKNEQYHFYNSQHRKLIVKGTENILGKNYSNCKRGKKIGIE